MTNPYETLGVSRTATAEEIKSAYRKKAKEYHPDLHPDDPHATDKMNEINQAYEILSDANKKAMYDAGYTDDQGRPKTNPYNPYGNPYGSGNPYSNFYNQQGQNANSGFRYYTYNPFTGFRSYGARPGSMDDNSQNGNPYSNSGNPYSQNGNPYSQNGNPYSKGNGILGPTGRRILRIVGFLLLWRVIGRFLPFWFFFF